MEKDGSTPGNPASAIAQGLVTALMGYGKLLERDYWAVIDRSALKPSQVVELVARRFPECAPRVFASFRRVAREAAREDLDPRQGPPDKTLDSPSAPTHSLQPGDELEVTIPGVGVCGVRVLHRGPTSFTLGTLPGHPEAGRITFGAYRNRRGDVIFHIRSRARSGSRQHLLGFLTAGDPMQTNTWTEFVNRVALTVGEGVVGFIHADKRKSDDEPDDPEVLCSPTFLAEAD